jgi:hypothetical protein
MGWQRDRERTTCLTGGGSKAACQPRPKEDRPAKKGSQKIPRLLAQRLPVSARATSPRPTRAAWELGRESHQSTTALFCCQWDHRVMAGRLGVTSLPATLQIGEEPVLGCGNIELWCAVLCEMQQLNEISKISKWFAVDTEWAAGLSPSASAGDWRSVGGYSQPSSQSRHHPLSLCSDDQGSCFGPTLYRFCNFPRVCCVERQLRSSSLGSLYSHLVRSTADPSLGQSISQRSQSPLQNRIGVGGRRTALHRSVEQKARRRF